MLRKVFWEDPYLTRLDTEIATVDGDDVTLAATIIYAFSGGQESDAGTIGGRSVLAAKKFGTDIVYTLSTGHGLAAGDCPPDRAQSRPGCAAGGRRRRRAGRRSALKLRRPAVPARYCRR